MADTTEQARELSAALRAMRGPWLGDGHRKIHAPYAADTIDALAAKLEQMREADILARYSLDDGRREWVNVGTWLHPGEVIAHMDGASLAQEPAAPAPAEPSAQVAVPTHPERYYRWTGSASVRTASSAGGRRNRKDRR